MLTLGPAQIAHCPLPHRAHVLFGATGRNLNSDAERRSDCRVSQSPLAVSMGQGSHH